MSIGWTDSAVAAAVEAQRWRHVPLLPGVYATCTGELGFIARVWAAVLHCGPGAHASHSTAALLDGLDDVDEAAPPSVISITVPSQRRVATPRTVKVHYSAWVAERRHPSRQPPRLQLPHTVLDLWEQEPFTGRGLDEGLALVARACQRRLTTPDRLLRAARERKKLRRRAELEEALRDVATGAHSLLELQYLRRVERAHGLPVGERQHAHRTGHRRIFIDVYYRGFRLRIELDGRGAHPEDLRWLDAARDNAALVDGDLTLRLSWADAIEGACASAGQVASVLMAQGWTGRPRRCGPTCQLSASLLS